MPYVHAQERNKTSSDVLFTDSEGASFVRQGGSRAWRNNNPGNLRYTPFSQAQGAIGKAGGFAVFPDYQAGHEALKALLQTDTYSGLTIEKAVKRYAPPSENGTEAYKKNLKKITGLDIERLLGKLNADELESVVRAIEKLEGTISGKEQAIARVVGTVIDKGRIVSYVLDGNLGTVGKARAVEMALSGQLDAVVVAGKSGPYLRSRPDLAVVNNFDALAMAA
ncbi:MAG: hypothetical protein EOP38_22395 [Rubrivivax sp.]|nr:MAG: hypothetical protein EOP38_22395 [Rubrivivax sp.]